MLNTSSKQALVFNKRGEKMSIMDLPQLFYLDTENEWVRKQLFRAPALDGMCLIINWETREIKSVRFAENS